MHRRRLLAAAGAAMGALAGCSGGSERTTLEAFAVSSPAMESGDSLPPAHTCEAEGGGQSPPITIDRVPEPTAGLAVVAEADLGPINEPVFWSLWNVPPTTGAIPAGLPRTPTVDALNGARQGRQSGGEPGYSPPCPPAGTSVELRFQVYAQREALSASGGALHDEVVERLQQATLASRRITVTYRRPSDAGTTADG
jgi:phosphatidylethanolamine-binding protein (PEBP) family uncharacterized protein